MAKKTKTKGVARELERSGALCLAFANTAAPPILRPAAPGLNLDDSSGIR